MITLYKPTETDFTHNGEAVLDNITISAVILHKLNGEYSLEIELLKDDRGKYKLLRQHSIIKACGQLFRLYSQENIQDTEVKIKAVLYHITYDINLDIIEDYRAVDCKADFALGKVVLDKRFTVLETDIETINTAYFVDELPFDGIHKKILERWGGELLQDNFNIGIKKTIGTVSPVTVTFRKNIKGFTEIRDYKGVYTRVKPVGKDGLTIGDVNNGSDWLVSPRAGDYFKVLSAVIKFEDIESPLELKNKVLNELWGTIDLPLVSFKIDFIDLSNTVEYKRFTNLRGLNTGDTIKVYHEYFNVNLVAKVQETKRNAITGEVEELVLGDLVKDFVEGIQGAVEDIVEKKGNTILKQTKDMISLEVSDVREEVSQKYDELGNAIGETDKAIVRLDSKLSITAEEIGAEISSNVSRLDGKINSANSSIQQNANSISTNISETNKIKDTVTGIESTVSSHSSSITQLSNQISTKVTRGDVTSIIKQSPDAVQVGFNGINNKVVMNSSGLTVNGGAIKVVNNSGQVVIDGSSNIFKIHNVIDLNLDAGSNLNYSYTIKHGLGYVPAYSAFEVATVSNVGGNTMLPALTISGTENGVLRVTGIIRCNADEQNVYITFVRSDSSIGGNFKVRIFIFKEALL